MKNRLKVDELRRDHAIQVGQFVGENFRAASTEGECQPHTVSFERIFSLIYYIITGA